jgi:membrane protein YqaA with SNARE-associated domain
MDALLRLLEADGTSLWAMFVVAFVAATVLPLSSELLLVALVRMHPGQVPAILAVATLGNTLGGMTTYALGRWARGHVTPAAATSPWAARVRRWGAPALLLAWAPVVGDLLCALAGYFRVPGWRAALSMAAGKLARYWALAAGAGLL